MADYVLDMLRKAREDLELVEIPVEDDGAYLIAGLWRVDAAIAYLEKRGSRTDAEK